MSREFRVRYGMAIGRENNFYAGISSQKGYLAGTDGLFAQGNTAPDVTLGNLFYTNNSSNTTIVDFTLGHPSQGTGNLAGLFEGKLITVYFIDDSTRLARSARLVTVGTDGWQAAGTVMTFLYHNSAWVQIGAERTQSDYAVLNSGNLTVAAAGTTFLARGLKTIAYPVANNSATGVLTGLTGGEQNQEVTLWAIQSDFRIIANSAGFTNGFYVTSTGGTQVLVASNATLSFRFLNGNWFESR